MKCEIIKDLLPSFIDELTSEVSNEAVEEHLAQCESCRAYYEGMKNGNIHAQVKMPKEVDYFLRIREETFRKVMVAIMLTAVALSLFYGGYQTYYGTKSVRSFDVNVTYEKEEDGFTDLIFSAAEEGWVISAYQGGYEEEIDGEKPVLTIGVQKCRKNPFRYQVMEGRCIFFFHEKGSAFDLVTVGDAWTYVYDEDDFIAVRFQDCVKTITLADLRDGDISSLQ